MKLTNAYSVLSHLPASVKTGFFCLAFALPSSAFAQTLDQSIEEFAKTLPDEILVRIAQRGVQYLPEITRWIFQISPDGNASLAAAALQGNQQLAVARAREITNLLRYDLNGDGDLSAGEVQLQLPYLGAQDRADLSLKFREGDQNSDQTLSFSEILTLARAKDAQQARRSNTQMIEIIMAFDYNQDGLVNLDEAAAVIAAIDPADLEQAGTRPQPRIPDPVRCSAPKPQPESEVVFVNGYEGSAVSSIAVSGQDVETSVATIIIAEGTTPIYLFVTAYDAIIWNFDGATERVQQIVVQPRTTRSGPGAAVAGIDKNRITFVDPGSCVGRVSTQRNGETERSLLALSRYLERDFDLIINEYTLGNVRLANAGATSGETPSRPYRTKTEFSIGERNYELSAAGMSLAGAEPPADAIRTVRAMMRYYPGGLVALPFEAVHSAGSVMPYHVLPQQAGLLQLMAEGSIEFRREGSYYYIKKPILRFPAGLNGGHSVKFVLAQGVPMPAGSPGHSSVVLEETGECVRGARCR